MEEVYWRYVTVVFRRNLKNWNFLEGYSGLGEKWIKSSNISEKVKYFGDIQQNPA